MVSKKSRFKVDNAFRELFATGKIQFDSSIKRANLKDCFKFNEKKLVSWQVDHPR